MDDSLSHVAAVAVLLVLSAVFSGTETALLTLGKAGVHHLLKQEKKRSRLLELWRDRPDHVLSSLLIANNLVNILASAVATAFSHKFLASHGVTGSEGWSVALAVGVMTFLIVMFGEIVPKTFAKNNAARLLPVFPVTLLACWVFRPFSSVLQKFSARLIAAGGGATALDEPSVTEAEVEAMISLGTSEGVLSEDKRQLLSSIIKFSDTMTMEIMVPRTDVVGFPVDAGLDDVIHTVETSKFSRYPVYKGDIDSIIGLLNVKDLLGFLAEHDRQKFSLKRLVSHDVMVVPETKKIGDLLREFQQKHQQMAVAVDEFGGTAGIVTTEDVIEEIVGEIYDEHDKTEEDFKELGDGIYLLHGRAPIERLEELFGIELPEQDIYESVGGLVLTQAGKVPLAGESVEFAGLRFEVRERTRTRILRLVVKRAETPGPGGDTPKTDEEGR